MDDELYVLMANENTVNKHLNNVQQLIKGDHVDLISMQTSLKGYTRKISDVLKWVPTRCTE